MLVLITVFTSNLFQSLLQQHGASPYHWAWAVSVSVDLSTFLVDLSYHWFIGLMFHICFLSRPIFLLCSPCSASVPPMLFRGSFLQLYNIRPLFVQFALFFTSASSIFFIHGWGLPPPFHCPHLTIGSEETLAT